MKLTKIVAYITAQLLRAWVTACSAVMVYVPMSALAYAERGYKAIGGEIVPVILIAGAVWGGMGWLGQTWYRDMVGRRKHEEK